MMKSKCRKQKLLFALRILFVAKLLCFVSPVMGQSKLSRVRQAVRKTETPKDDSERKRPKSTRQTKTKTSDDGAQKRAEPRRQSQNKPPQQRKRRDSGRSVYVGHNHFAGAGFDPGCDFVIGPAPRPVIHTREIHVIEPTYVAPQQQVIQHPVQQPIQPTILQPEPIFESNEVIVEEIFGDSFDNWGVRITPWYGAGIDDISQGNLGLLFQASGSLGLDMQFRNVREKGFSDHLWLGDLNLVFEPIATEDLRMRLGVGMNWLGDAYGADVGLNLTAGFDMRLTNRLIVTGEVDFGNLGASDYLHTQISVGYQVGYTELMIGYDHTAIGNVDLDSPFVGMRFRF